MLQHHEILRGKGMRFWAVAFGVVLATGISAWANGPPNDRFAEAADLGSVAEAVLEGDNTHATVEAEEIVHLGPDFGGTLWWKWTAPGVGVVYVKPLPHANHRPPLGSWRYSAFEGDDLGGLTNLLGGNAFASEDGFRLVVATGQQMSLMAAAQGHSPAGALRLGLSFAPGPTNDDFADRTQVMVGGSVTLTGDGSGASREPGEPVPLDWSDPGGSLWWELAPAEPGFYEIRISNPSHPTTLYGVYAGDSVGTLEALVAGRGSHVRQFFVGAGESVNLSLQSSDPLDRSPLGVEITRLDPAHANHDVTLRADLGAAPVHLDGTLQGARLPSAQGDYSLWYSWTAPGAGTLELSFSDPGTSLAVYRDPTGDASDFVGISGSTVDVQAGETVAINVHSLQPASFSLHALFHPTPSNDLIGGAVDLGSAPAFTVAGDPTYATSDLSPTPVALELFSSIWWTAEAPADGLLFLDLEALQSVLGISVFSGDTPGSMSEVRAVRKEVGEIDHYASTSPSKRKPTRSCPDRSAMRWRSTPARNSRLWTLSERPRLAR